MTECNKDKDARLGMFLLSCNKGKDKDSCSCYTQKI